MRSQKTRLYIIPKDKFEKYDFFLYIRNVRRGIFKTKHKIQIDKQKVDV